MGFSGNTGQCAKEQSLNGESQNIYAIVFVANFVDGQFNHLMLFKPTLDSVP